MAVIARIKPTQKSVVLRPFEGRALAESAGIGPAVGLAACQMLVALALALGLAFELIGGGAALRLMLSGASLVLSFMALAGLASAFIRQIMARPVFLMKEEDGKLVARPSATAFPLWAEPITSYKDLRIRRGWWPRKGWRRLFARRKWLVEARHANPDRIVMSGPFASMEDARAEAEMLAHRMELPLIGVD